MDATVIKGVEGLELNGSDAAVRKRRMPVERFVERFVRSSSGIRIRRIHKMPVERFVPSSSRIRRISRMSVEGYDTSSCREDVEEALRKHFASRDIQLIHASAPQIDDRTILCRYALIYLREEDEEKALKFDESDMGGRILRVAAYPFGSNRLEPFFAPTKAQDKYLQRTLFVTGFDNSLTEDDLEVVVRRFIPGCGCFVLGEGRVLVNLRGQDAIDKALQLSGEPVGGFEIAVNDVRPLKKMGTIGVSQATIAAMTERCKAARLAMAEKDKATLPEGNQKTIMTTD